MNNTDSWSELVNDVWFWVDVEQGFLRFRYQGFEGCAEIDFVKALETDPDAVYKVLFDRACDFKRAVELR